LAWDNPTTATNRSSDAGAGKLISSLLGIVGRPSAVPSGKPKAPGGFGPRFYAVPGAPVSPSLQ
jgi:hypothetical protein